MSDEILEYREYALSTRNLPKYCHQCNRVYTLEEIKDRSEMVYCYPCGTVERYYETKQRGAG